MTCLDNVSLPTFRLRRIPTITGLAPIRWEIAAEQSLQPRVKNLTPIFCTLIDRVWGLQPERVLAMGSLPLMLVSGTKDREQQSGKGRRCDSRLN